MTKYFAYTALFLLILMPPIFSYLLIRRFKKLMFFKNHFKKIVSRLEKREGKSVIITPILKKLIFFLAQNAPDTFKSLEAGFYHKVQNRLKQLHREDLAADLDFLFNGNNQENKVLAHTSATYRKAQENKQKAKTALNNGDLENAAWFAQESARLFAKAKSPYEQGQSMLLSGLIFRMSSLFDTAFFMYESAKKIYTDLQAEGALAEVLGYFGMLSVLQQQFDNAENYFVQALTLCLQNNRQQGAADIYNQLALLDLHKNNYQQALTHVSLARKAHRAVFIEKEAFSLEICGKALFSLQRFHEAADKFEAAALAYQQCKNISGELDAMFDQAQTEFSLEDYTKAEKTLRKIIEKAVPNGTGCFHLANVYNLLGLIYLWQKDWKRAKGLFEQSLNLELRNGRLKAAACDYANISLAETKLGRLNDAALNLINAKNYAAACGDENLSQEIEKAFQCKSS